MPRFPVRLASFDIDGTLTTGHGWRYLAGSLGRGEEYEAQQARYEAGTDSEEAHLRALLNLAKGTPLRRGEEFLEGVPKPHGIEETVRALSEAGVVAVLLSHNPPWVTRWYARRFGFKASDGTVGGPRPPTRDGTLPGAGRIRPDKVGGIARLLRRFRVPPGQAAHFGDSRPDVPVFHRVGVGIAVNPSEPFVARSADRSLRLTDLRSVLPVLEEVRPRAVPPLEL